jgi:hypothetical protein
VIDAARADPRFRADHTKMIHADLLRFMPVTLAKLAFVHKQSGDIVKAGDFLRKGQAIMARLTKLSPDNAQWKQDLVRFNRQIAELSAR